MPKVWTHQNYCNNTPRCVKCIGNHLTKDCTRKSSGEGVICVNCQEHHPANYRGCVVHKQLQQKIYPALLQRILPSRSLQSGMTYARALTYEAQQLNTASDTQHQTASPKTQQTSDLTNLKEMMKKLMKQMGTLLNLLTTFITRAA